jgi:hypothetical protein
MIDDPKQAKNAQNLIGYKAALGEFSKKLREYGGSSGQILFVLYPDGSMAPGLNGSVNPHQILAAIKFLTQIVDEQIAALAIEDGRMNGRAMPVLPQ